MTLSAVVIGASGYTGGELLRLLARHPEVELVGAHAFKKVGQKIYQIHPNLRGLLDLTVTKADYSKVREQADVVFAATPHGVAMKFVPELLKGKAKVIDLSADYRFDDPKVFERYYVKHESPEVKAVYGLPELYRAKIKKAKLIANPGCYPVGAILGLAPLLKEGLVDTQHIVIDAKSGTSGAGAPLSEVLHHPTCASNLQAYKATTHRHGPEINQELSKLAGEPIKAFFTPHLIPIVRGILSTSHLFMKETMSKEDLLKLYQKFYRGEPFVRVLDELPQIGFVVGSNYCDIGMEPEADTGRLVVVSAIDNLIKGASGQAIQNMNLLFGLDETKGLEAPSLRPW